MSKVLTYERDSYLKELEVEVVDVGETDGRPYAILDDTILYPEGGGQPADHGWLGESTVVDVQRVDGAIHHYLGAVERAAGTPGPKGTSRLTLDWDRRYDHMQQHTAQHVLTAIAADRFGWQTTSFHLGSARSDIELDARGLLADDLDILEGAAVEVVRAALPVSARRVSREELDRLDVRTRGLPADHGGDVRLVEIEGIDLNTCGGTHLRSTAEIETIKLLSTESMRGGIRLYWVAGGRVRRLLATHEHRSAELRGLFETSDEELVTVAATKLEQQKLAARRARTLEESLAEEAVRSLQQQEGPVAEAHFKGVDGGFLQQVARRFSETGRAQVALLTASGEKGGFFVIAASTSSVDVGGLGSKTAELLGGRGGGSGQLFQGKAGSLERRAAALRMLVDELD